MQKMGDVRFVVRRVMAKNVFIIAFSILESCTKNPFVQMVIPPLYIFREGGLATCRAMSLPKNECDGKFSSCTVVEPNGNVLLVHAPDLATLRRALISCKDEVRKTKVTLNKNNKKKGK